MVASAMATGLVQAVLVRVLVRVLVQATAGEVAALLAPEMVAIQENLRVLANAPVVRGPAAPRRVGPPLTEMVLFPSRSPSKGDEERPLQRSTVH